ncbi:hypothetical protein [Gloeothece verrucosa]|uniref:Uncharacterized protein n=1 Tax=Gloeothece verrucosa (strain PCC 7822) TaxID=497965 RepID=E0UAH4_GLOV7|nr:hypothetical protein [Gloeothece verrucosa]ADN12715.1 hypothetical protein Cyan7822_0679 [Gloeothece verrucosa PCC 7822]
MGRSKELKLASFEIDPQTWEEFKEKCKKSGTSARAVLVDFIKQYVEAPGVELDLEPDVEAPSVEPDLELTNSRANYWGLKPGMLVKHYMYQKLKGKIIENLPDGLVKIRWLNGGNLEGRLENHNPLFILPLK